MTTTQAPPRTGRALVEPVLFDKLAARITHDHPILDRQMAERITDQALAFLAAGATATQPLGPSALVDIGWHTFLIHTRDYTAFCEQVAGRYIHHEPSEEGETGVALSAAVNAIRANGYFVDTELWVGSNGADCKAECCLGGGGGE